MEIVKLTETNTEECVARVAAVLRKGGVILYPTDPLYGLGADAFSDAAVAKIYEIKNRDASKPMHCVVADIPMAETYAELDPRARLLAQRYLPGPLTLVVAKKPAVTSGIARHIATIGIRIPANAFCIALARSFGKPYTTTSANASNSPQRRHIDDIVAQMGENASLIDLVIDAGALPMRFPSTIVDTSSPELRILREGMISARQIEETLGIAGGI
jgi:L-threonylcarbamoyladenylate synthase